ncbi:MAG TPA: DUF2298 domain-containing protein [Ktedonobacterales bacterium]|nr:DUF2298 domain-containing protein [Ktedonobacterales bacterium]
MPENGIRRGKRARTRDAGANAPAASATQMGALAALGASAPTAQSRTPMTPAGRATRLLASLTTRATRWLDRQDWTLWALLLISLLALIPRLYGLNWDSGNHLHPDERQIVFKAMCVTLPGTPRASSCDPAYTGPGWLLSASSPLNTHFFAYGSFPQYLLAVAAHGMAWFSKLTGLFKLSAGNAWDDFNHFTLIGRVLSALFDAGSVLLAGMIARRLTGRRAALLAAAFVAVIPFNAQVSHFYAVDTLLLFFVLLTLYGCIQLAQGPLQRAAKPNSGDEAFPRPAFWSAWGGGVFIGVSFGLAMATKVSALPLLAPILVALLLRWRRRGLEEALLALLGLGAAAVIAYLLTSPYTLIDWKNFQLQVNEQTNLSQGKLDYPYVRQFAGTTPFIYEIRQLLLYDMGVPLGVAGLAGFGWAVSRVWRRLDSDWGILVVWTLGYFAVIGSAYTKFSRYMLPVFTPLAICAAAMIAALAVWGTRRVQLVVSSPPDPLSFRGEGEPNSPSPRKGKGLGDEDTLWRRATSPITRLTTAATRLWGPGWWRIACGLLAATILGATLFLTLALVNIYSAPNTRVQASVWIYDHVAAGSTLTNEVWDDPLPIQAPPARDVGGVPYTAAGHRIDPYQYPELGLNLYDADTPAKAQQLATQLTQADVVVISSQRLLRSIPKLPDRYPMTTRYYQMLFNGQLGFTLAATFENHPHLLGFTLDESGADESFSVYDHPPVWIFVKNGAGLTQSQTLARLTDGLSLPATSNRSGAQKSLLLSPQNVAANAQAQAIGTQFPANSVANSIPLLWWLVMVELLGLVSFPLTFYVFRGLHDRGWGFSKVVGLLLLAWMTWLPASVRLLPFDHWIVVAMFALLACVGGAVGWWRRRELLAFARDRWRVLVLCEALFLVAFLFFVWIRAQDPDLWHIYRGGEKPMELAFLNGILRSRYMPPLDPWFSGGYINYYYYGQYLVAVLIKLTGVAPTTAFNLAIPLLFGVTITGAFSIVCGITRRWWAGVAAAFGLAVVGNLDGLAQLWGQWQVNLAQLWIQWQGAPAHQPPLVTPLFDYWRSSRVIPNTINEFPYWSFLYADLHAHLIDLPVVLLMIGVCASLLAGAKADGRRWLPALPALGMLALALGAAWCISTWDLPTYAILFAVALGLRQLPFGEPERWRSPRLLLTWPLIRNYVAALLVTFGATYALYFPFHADFQNFVSGTGPVTVATDPLQFLTIYGLWLFIVVSFFFVELYDRLKPRFAALSPYFEEQPLRGAWALGLVGVFALAVAYLLGVKAILALLLIVGLGLALNTRHSPVKLLTYALILLALAVALGVEFIYIRDFLDHSAYERMNTVFKFGYQVWTMLALGGALAVAQMAGLVWPSLFPAEAAADREQNGGPAASISQGPPTKPASEWMLPRVTGADALRVGWTIALTFLVCGSLVFLFEGTRARLADPAIWAQVQPPPGGIQPQGLSLDGMAYMRGWYPTDYAAINWMNTHIQGDPTIVEASNGNYAWYGRVSIYTGLPAVLGWGSREYEQRYGEEVFPRQSDVQQFWATDDPNAAVSFLRQFGVQYIYLGELERTCYVTQGNGACVPMGAGAIAKFQTLERAGVVQSVYTNTGVTIYEVSG